MNKSLLEINPPKIYYYPPSLNQKTHPYFIQLKIIITNQNFSSSKKINCEILFHQQNSFCVNKAHPIKYVSRITDVCNSTYKK